ncbi:acyl-CoA dehydrogenase family protein [Saccharothrix variisporea]|uniref:Alkylation response protein AidB-like acyl-CoA dehydrogenase n=1 Tax=Saccharothrix variisporea TaxID=543527 RepID=A0A495XQA8_9PSEU|nr:acyl-CoA dehydrogenase family protein [Saccharothrix variisporea]RKT74633.1 alkylation response protein AidB-like acyl-CoA dehydrogenase [Saccharothrix variisporea]
MTLSPSPVDAPPAAADILARARALAPHLRERAAEIENARRLPDDIVDMLRGTGVYRMGFNRDWGGPELSSTEQVEVIEALAYGDASAAWCAEIGSHTGLFATYLDRSVAREMFTDLDTITTGALFPVGRADRVPGGYRLSGRWTFGSGITHCDWVISGAFIYRDGEPEPSPDGDPHDSRLFMVPASDVTVIDQWHTTGMLGTGSCDYTITDVFVPEERSLSFDTVRDPSGPHTQPEAFMRYMPGIPLGVARAALDHVRELVTGRERGGVRWADNTKVQVTIAECEADLAATRHGVFGALRRLSEVLEAGGTLDDLTRDERAALPLSRLHSFRVARSIVNRLYDLVQTAAIHRSSPLDRWLRDTTTMCQHVFAQDRILQSAGAHLLGGTPEFRLCLGLVK